MSREYHERYRVREVVEEARDLRRLVFDRELESEPGNYVMMWIPGISERPFSVMGGRPLELGIKRVGPFTRSVFELEPGDEVLVRGPYGNSFMDFVKEDGRKLLVCGGFGSVPLRFLAKRLKGHDVSVLAGAGSREDLPAFLDEMDVLRTTDDGSEGLKGMVTEHIGKLEPRSGDRFYICGPESMMAAAAEEAGKYVGEEDIIVSVERHMKCGRGICGSCEMDGYRTCVDGPVFSYKQIMDGDFGNRKRLKSGRIAAI